MQYRVVFDLAQVGYKSWSFPALGLIFIAIAGLLLILQRGGVIKGTSPLSTASPYFMGLFALLWTVVTFGWTYGEYRSLQRALSSGQVQVIEGEVTNFVPMPYQGHAMERFDVGAYHFEYSDYVVTAGFNHTSSHGGPIRAGLRVRVTFVGDTIVRLEVEQ